MLSSIDILTTATWSLVVFIWNVAPVLDISGTTRVGGLAAWLATIVAVLNISDIMQPFNRDKSRSISQLIKGKSRDLLKFHKYFNGTTTYVFKGIVKWAEPCKCVILFVSRILWHKKINPSLKEWRFWYLILTGNLLP